MSDYRAIAAVAESLKALLEDRMDLTLADLPPTEKVTITVSHPDLKPSTLPSGPRLNLFLYEISHNPFLRNQEIGGPGAPGHPPLALDLHFLLTCFPPVETDDLTMHAVLGDAMRVLHDTPVLTEQLTRTRGITAGDAILSPALQGAHERIKITFRADALEIGSKIWQSLKNAYRLSVAFSVSVVQIESRKSVITATPVQEPRLQVGPRQPVLEAAQNRGDSQ